jgi:hypothetical protein
MSRVCDLRLLSLYFLLCMPGCTNTKAPEKASTGPITAEHSASESIGKKGQDGDGSEPKRAPEGRIKPTQRWPSPRLATQPGGAGVGLVHSGYSGGDPDGKTVVLTLSLAAKLVEVPEDGPPLPTVEGDLESQDDWLLDLAIPSAPDEAERLRASAKLPRPVGELSTTQLVSLRWTNVDGKTLYLWLTDKETGLRFYYVRKNANEPLPNVPFYTPGKDLLSGESIIKDLSSGIKSSLDALRANP